MKKKSKPEKIVPTLTGAVTKTYLGITRCYTSTLPEEEKKVGAKGQVVISKMRNALKISPGSKVSVSLEDNRVVVQKKSLDPASVFERIAKSGKGPAGKISPHMYEEELEERHHGPLKRLPRFPLTKPSGQLES